MPSGAERATVSREAARRRAASAELTVVAGLARYAGGLVMDGLPAEAAARVMAEAARELEASARELFRLAGQPKPLDPARRRERAAELSASGVPTGQVAARLGVNPRTVRKWRRRAAPLVSSRRLAEVPPYTA